MMSCEESVVAGKGLKHFLQALKQLEGEVPMGQLSDRSGRLLWLRPQGCSSTAACFSGRREGLKVRNYQALCVIHVPLLRL